MQINNKLKQIKPIITLWPSTVHRKIDVLLTCLRFGHSRIACRHLLLGEAEPTCPHCFSRNLTIHHVLTDCCGLCNLYRHYRRTTSPHLIDLVGKKSHCALFHFFKRCQFLLYHLSSIFSCFNLKCISFFIFMQF